jgi:hypothetical protein
MDVLGLAFEGGFLSPTVARDVLVDSEGTVPLGLLSCSPKAPKRCCVMRVESPNYVRVLFLLRMSDSVLDIDVTIPYLAT